MSTSEKTAGFSRGRRLVERRATGTMARRRRGRARFKASRADPHGPPMVSTCPIRRRASKSTSKIAGQGDRRLGREKSSASRRRQFLQGTGGMAASFLAIERGVRRQPSNVSQTELFEPAGARRERATAGTCFVFRRPRRTSFDRAGTPPRG